jgi:hypothetical protein
MSQELGSLMRAAATRLCIAEREPGDDETPSWSRQFRALARIATSDIILGAEVDGRGARTQKEDVMLIQLRGKVRRAVVGTMLSEEDRASIAGARQGECNRCGACCKILFTCPFLVEDEGVFACSVYDHRPPSCRLFPMVPADLREVDRCAFSFEKPR